MLPNRLKMLFPSEKNNFITVTVPRIIISRKNSKKISPMLQLRKYTPINGSMMLNAISKYKINFEFMSCLFFCCCYFLRVIFMVQFSVN